MDKPKFFSATLGLSAPWSITAITFSKEENRLDIHIEYLDDTSINCPECGCDSNIHCMDDETWCHNDFFRYTAYLHARVPLVECTNGCGHRKLTVPWARPGTKFRLVADPVRDAPSHGVS